MIADTDLCFRVLAQLLVRDKIIEMVEAGGVRIFRLVENT